SSHSLASRSLSLVSHPPLRHLRRGARSRPLPALQQVNRSFCFSSLAPREPEGISDAHLTERPGDLVSAARGTCIHAAPFSSTDCTSYAVIVSSAIPHAAA